MDPSIQLRFREHRSATVGEIRSDNIRGKPGAQTTKLGFPLVMGTDYPKVSGALFVGTLCNGTQPGGVILLSDALGHRRQIFGVNPATTIFEKS
jgi:hypothetical protein